MTVNWGWLYKGGKILSMKEERERKAVAFARCTPHSQLGAGYRLSSSMLVLVYVGGENDIPPPHPSPRVYNHSSTLVYSYKHDKTDGLYDFREPTSSLVDIYLCF